MLAARFQQGMLTGMIIDITLRGVHGTLMYTPRNHHGNGVRRLFDPVGIPVFSTMKRTAPVVNGLEVLYGHPGFPQPLQHPKNEHPHSIQISHDFTISLPTSLPHKTPASSPLPSLGFPDLFG